MKDILKLVHPINSNGKKIKEVSYDTEEITVQGFSKADARAKATAQKSKTMGMVAELDSGLHIQLGIQAVIALNPTITEEELENMKGTDAAELMKIGRSFFTKSAEILEQKDSEEQLEITPELITET